MRHKQEAALQNSEIDGALNQAFPAIQETLEKWTQRGSGWVVDQVETLWLDIARYQPLRGASYIPLPAAVRNKKAVVNIKNKDNHCFWWNIVAAENPVDVHPERPGNYPQQAIEDFDRNGIISPVPISQIPRTERQNNRAVNLFGWDKGAIVHHISKQPEDIPRINMLLIEKAGKTHYARSKNLNRLLYDSSKHKERKHFCERCLHGYTREDQLEAHKPECRGIGQTAVRVDMTKEGKNKLAFQNHHKQLPAPNIIYADFEALTAKVEGPEPDPAKRTQHHEACSYSYIVVRCDGRTEPPVEYRGPNAAGNFLEPLQEEERKIKAVLADPKAMRMTRGGGGGTGVPSAPLRRATYVTNLSWATPCMTTATLQVNIEGRPILPATSSYSYPPKPPLSPLSSTICVAMTHLLMQAISKAEGRVHCIPNNTEKHISFSLGQLRFIDSVQFLLASHDRLVAANPPEAFRITRARQKETGALVAQGRVSLRVHGQLGPLYRTQIPHEGGLLQQAL